MTNSPLAPSIDTWADIEKIEARTRKEAIAAVIEEIDTFVKKADQFEHPEGYVYLCVLKEKIKAMAEEKKNGN